MKIKQLVYGVASFIPGIDKLYQKIQKTGGTTDSRYCYSIWMRHLVMMEKNGYTTKPKVVAELGPGDSIGIGLMALLTGSSNLFTLDVVHFSSIEENLKVFDKLVVMLKRKDDIPGEGEYPKVKPYLDNYTFPHKILTKDRLIESLEPLRLKMIRNSIINHNSFDSVIKYKVPWLNDKVIAGNAIDYLISNSVLEHVNDLDVVYDAMFIWLKKGGVMAHQVDFKCHGTASEWNGHWMYSDFLWSLIRGRRVFLLNRSYLSMHVDYINKLGFKRLFVVPTMLKTDIEIKNLPDRFCQMTENDLTVSSAFVQCVK
jgi:hypothetical protein